MGIEISNLNDGAPAQSTDIAVVDRVASNETFRLTLADLSTLFATTLATVFAALAHKTRHENGGLDEIDVSGLSGLLADAQKVAIHKNGTIVGTRKNVNLIEGTNVTLTIADDGVDDEVDVTIAAASASGAPSDAEYIVATANAGLSAERVGTDTTTVDWDYGTAGQAKLNVIPGGIKLDDLGTPDDNTDLNASTGQHGLLKKLSNIATEFLNGQGNWAEPGSPTYCYVASDVPITSAGFVDITGLTFAVEANKIYAIDGYIIYQSSTTAMGVLFGVNGPASPTTVEFFNQKQFGSPATTSTDSMQYANITAYDTPNPNSTAEPVQNINQNEVIIGIFENGANAGTFAFRMSKENVAGTATVKKGSWIRYKKLN